MAEICGSGRLGVPTAQLTGAAEGAYVRRVVAALRGARLNTQYPPSRPLVAHIEGMSPEVHGRLYGGLEIDLRSGLPTYKEWVRVSADKAVGVEALRESAPREQLVAKARAQPESIHGKQLLKHDYYQALRDRPLAELTQMEVALRRIEPDKNRAHFSVRLDKLDVSGVFVRYTIELAQTASVWNRPMVTLNEDTAGHTEVFRTMIYRYAALDAELTFAQLTTLGNLSIEKVVKGTVGPFFFSGMPAPAPLKTILTAREGFVATFGLEMVATDLERDTDNDPLEDEASAMTAANEAAEPAAPLRYRVFRDRKFVVPRALLEPVQAYCTAVGTRNVIYSCPEV